MIKKAFLTIVIILLPSFLCAELKEIEKKSQDEHKKSAGPYIVKYHTNSTIKMYEAIDSNSDGELDTWYYYNTKGQRVRQEIDSNFDGKIDIWVYFRDGLFIERIAKDTNDDGRPDSEQIYK